ncbi:DNA translocase FtsK 4TM domain-containing protein, partial [Thiomonas sp.]
MAGAIAWLLLLLAMFSYHRNDPSWSTSGAAAAQGTANLVGAAGAWTADILYFLLGFSALWLLPMGLLALLRAWRRAHAQVQAAPRGWLAKVGSVAALGLLPLSSAALEATRLYGLKVYLPAAAGGVVGNWLGGLAQQLLGFTGSAIVLLAVFLLSLSWYAQMSWADAAERVGARIEQVWVRWHERRAQAQDRHAGAQALQEREADMVSEQAREAEEVFAPVYIEPPLAQVP